MSVWLLYAEVGLKLYGQPQLPSVIESPMKTILFPAAAADEAGRSMPASTRAANNLYIFLRIIRLGNLLN